ncbi:MAG: Uma2 family endonuclease [Bryobacterales bacterium]|nr:Uma2 family endonuclease [Bryobacterales bacterium]
MPFVLLDSDIGNEERARRPLTREDCAALEAQGLMEAGKYELLNGELIPKMSKKRWHVIVLRRLAAQLETVFGPDRIDREAPIDVQASDNRTNEPEPDIVVLRRSNDEAPERNPKASEVALVVEISDSSISTDLRHKAQLYARAGIADYWVVDINAQRVIVHRKPTPKGYLSALIYGSGEAISPLEKPEAEIAIDSLFQFPA